MLQDNQCFNIINYSPEQELIIREKIIQYAKGFYEVPFVHRGRTIRGVDCSGLLILTHRRVGINLPNTDGNTYINNWHQFLKPEDQRYLNILLKYFYEVEEPKKGDIATFKFLSKHLVTHVGIALDKENFIHAQSGKWVCYGRFDHPYWKHRFHNFMRYRGFMKG